MMKLEVGQRIAFTPGRPRWWRHPIRWWKWPEEQKNPRSAYYITHIEPGPSLIVGTIRYEERRP